MSYQLTSTVLALGLAGIILWLIRRGHLHSRQALWWLIIAVTVVILGIFPKIIDWLALKLGVHYPPSLLFTLSIGMILLKILSIDIQQALMERRLRRLVQRLAILENEQSPEQKKDNTP